MAWLLKHCENFKWGLRVPWGGPFPPSRPFGVHEAKEGKEDYSSEGEGSGSRGITDDRLLYQTIAQSIDKQSPNFSGTRCQPHVAVCHTRPLPCKGTRVNAFTRYLPAPQKNEDFKLRCTDKPEGYLTYEYCLRLLAA